MNPQNTGLKVAGALFGLVGLLQLIRALRGWEIIINHREIPVGLSWLAAVVLCGLSIWLFRLARPRML